MLSYQKDSVLLIFYPIFHHGGIQMTLKTILFDLDGTLLPMNQETFAEAYFGLMAKKLAPHGYDPRALIAAIWKGTEVMVRNNGAQTNEQAFWQYFCSVFGEEAMKDEPIFDDYYHNEFQQVRNACGFVPEAAQIIEKCKALGLRIVLATNPLFPAVATHSRIRWAGLRLEDFELVTTYENACFCKPNPAYYQEIIDKLELNPAECLMVGNDVGEDMVAEKLGMRVFLLTDCLINRKGEDISQYPNGSFAELANYIEEQAH